MAQIFDCFAYKKMCFSQTSDGRLKLIYVTSDKDMVNTVVEEVVLGRYFMKALSVGGTIAMFTVGGQILVHGIGPVEHAIAAVTGSWKPGRGCGTNS
jgi:predicted DNA repair protein MutK